MPELRWGAGQAPEAGVGLNVRRLLAAAAVAVVVAGLGAHVLARVQLAAAEDRLAERREDLAAAADAAAAAAARAADAVAEIDELAPGLRAAQDELAERTRARNEAADALEAARARLAAVEAELDATSLTGELQARQVETLRACLRGVTGVLTAVAVDDIASAFRGLEAVAPRCAEAETVLVRAP